MNARYNLRLLPARRAQIIPRNVRFMENPQVVVMENPPLDIIPEEPENNPEEPLPEPEPLGPQINMDPAQNLQPIHNPLAVSFKPVSFNGLHPEVAGRWWRNFHRYATLSGIQGNGRCNLLGLLFTGSAEIWYNSLPPQTRDDYAALEAAFREKFITAAHTQLQRQMAVLSRTQRPAESVDEYITEARSKMVDYDYGPELQMTLLINGLRPEMKSAVMQHLPFQDIEAFINKARHVESALKSQSALSMAGYVSNVTRVDEDDSISTTPAPQLKCLEKNLQELSDKFETLAKELAKKSSENKSFREGPAPWQQRPWQPSRQYDRPSTRSDYQDQGTRFRSSSPWRGNSSRKEYKSPTCWKCGKIGHIQAHCRQKQQSTADREQGMRPRSPNGRFRSASPARRSYTGN